MQNMSVLVSYDMSDIYLLKYVAYGLEVICSNYEDCDITNPDVLWQTERYCTWVINCNDKRRK